MFFVILKTEALTITLLTHDVVHSTLVDGCCGEHTTFQYGAAHLTHGRVGTWGGA